MIPAQKLFHCLPALLLCVATHAQKAWPSPELETMYRNGETYLAMGNLKDAITTFRQGILLAPEYMLLNRELALSQYLARDYNGAEITMHTFLANYSSSADDSCYRILAMAEQEQGDLDGATKTLKKGLESFPSSGMLYREKGIVCAKEKRPEAALNAWIDGIERDPSYSRNYYEAFRIYLNSDNVLWGLFYGEIFLNNTTDTSVAYEVKKSLFEGYKKLFDNITNERKSAGFEEAAQNILLGLTPAVSDGITTENLTMLRTRFAMEWFYKYAKAYPFPLFSYWDELIRTGHFEIYNEWLFGMAERKEEYLAWNIFHEGDLARFEQWRSIHPLNLKKADHYNSRNFKGMFIHKKGHN